MVDLFKNIPDFFLKGLKEQYFSLVPLNPNSKVPIIKDYYNKRIFTQEDLLKSVPEGCTYNPEDFGFAVVILAKYFVLDVDYRSVDKNGYNSLKKLIKFLGLSPDYFDNRPSTNTPNNGLHYYIKCEQNLIDKHPAMLKGFPFIDIKSYCCSSRLITIPPTQLDSGAYEFIEGEEPEDFPTSKFCSLLEINQNTEAKKASIWTDNQAIKYLNLIDPHQFRDYERYLRLIFALHYVTAGSSEILRQLIVWASKDPEYRDQRHGDQTTNKWYSCNQKERADQLGEEFLLKQTLMEDYVVEDYLKKDEETVTFLSPNQLLDFAKELKYKDVIDHEDYEVINESLRYYEDHIYNRTFDEIILFMSYVPDIKKKLISKRDRPSNTNKIIDLLADQVRLHFIEQNQMITHTDLRVFHIFNGIHWREKSYETVDSILQNEITLKVKDKTRSKFSTNGTVIKQAREKFARVVHSPEVFQVKANHKFYLLNGKYIEFGKPLKETKPKKITTEDKFLNKPTVKFDPKAECPMFNTLCINMFGIGEEPTDLIDMLLGYLLCGVKTNKVSFLLMGEALSGKSTFAKIIWKMMDGMAMEGQHAELLNNPHETSELHGKRMFLEDDTGYNPNLNEAVIKKCIGGSMITANPKNKSKFTFESQVGFVLLSNSVFRTGELNASVRRRVVPLFFDKSIVKPDEEDMNYVDKMFDTGEASGILNRAIRGYALLKAHEDPFHRLSMVKEGVQRWCAAQSVEYSFFVKYDMPQKDFVKFESAKQIEVCYDLFMKELGNSLPVSYSLQKFEYRIRRLGLIGIAGDIAPEPNTEITPIRDIDNDFGL